MDENYEKLILDFKRKYETLMEYTNSVYPDVKITITWKLHSMVAHLPQFLRHYKTGMSMFAEQCIESAHADYKRTEKRFLVSESHEDHSKRLKRSVTEYNSRRL